MNNSLADLPLLGQGVADSSVVFILSDFVLHHLAEPPTLVVGCMILACGQQVSFQLVQNVTHHCPPRHLLLELQMQKG